MGEIASTYFSILIFLFEFLYTLLECELSEDGQHRRSKRVDMKL